MSNEISNYLSNITDMEITLTPNSAGYSKDIDGQVYK